MVEHEATTLARLESKIDRVHNRIEAIDTAIRGDLSGNPGLLGRVRVIESGRRRAAWFMRTGIAAAIASAAGAVFSIFHRP